MSGTDHEGPAGAAATASLHERPEVQARYRVGAALVVASGLVVLLAGLWQLWRVLVPVDMGPDTGDDASDRLFAAVALLGWVLPVVTGAGIVGLWRRLRTQPDAASDLWCRSRLPLAVRLATLCGAGLFVGTVLFVASRDAAFGATVASTVGGLVAASAAAGPWLACAAALRAVRGALVRRGGARP